MSDRTCGTCGTAFKFPSQLDRHLNGKKQCKPSVLNPEALCEYCNVQYSNKYNLVKHHVTCKAKLEAEAQANNNQVAVQQNNNALVINNQRYIQEYRKLQGYRDKYIKSLEDKIEEHKTIIDLLMKYQQTSQTIDINDTKFIQKFTKFIKEINKTNKQKDDEEQDDEKEEDDEEDEHNITVSQLANTLNNILNPTINNITNNTSNTSNTSNTNIQTQNNTINNVQNIQNIQNTQNNIVNNNLPNIIYPFDYEDISFITDDEKLNILTSSNGVELALEKIYSKPENRNFYRQNANKDNVSILGKDMKIQIKNLKQFNEQILNKGILLMERMFYTCKHKLSFNDQLLIWNNIEQNRELLAFEHYLVNIINLIETCFRDPISKDIFKKFSDKLAREEIYRKDKINIIKDLIVELERFNQDKTNITIDDDFLRTEVWSQEEHKSKDADEDNLKNNLDLVRIENTPRFKFFNDMRADEIEYFDMHGASIGNIIKYRSILLQRAKDEIERINKIYNNDALGTEVREKLITQPNDNMLSQLRNIKFNKDLEYNNNNTITV